MPYIKARIRKKQGGIIIHAALPLKKFVLYRNTCGCAAGSAVASGSSAGFSPAPSSIRI